MDQFNKPANTTALHSFINVGLYTKVYIDISLELLPYNCDIHFIHYIPMMNNYESGCDLLGSAILHYSFKSIQSIFTYWPNSLL